MSGSISSSDLPSPLSLRRIRITSIGCGLLAIAIRLAYLVNSGRLKPWGGWYIGSMVAAIAIPLALWLVLARRSLRRRPTFRIDVAEQRYIVGSWPLRHLSGVVMFAVALQGLIVQPVPHTDRVRLIMTDRRFVIFLALEIGAYLAAGLFLILRDRPRMTLDPAGMTVVRWRAKRQRVAWDDIAPGSAVLLPTVGRQLVWRPSAPGRAGLTALPASMLGIDPMFLLHAVRVYADQPERRSEIGTQAGLDRLQRERTDALALAAR